MCIELQRHFCGTKMYALAGQLRRAAVAIATNIAEAQARFTANEFHYFLGRARGSLVRLKLN
jgi:four helix bundle protein